MITPEEFLNTFPQAKLNIENDKINGILKDFISEYNHKFDKSWQTVGKLMKNHFKENDIVFPLRCNDMKIEFWTSRGFSEEEAKQNISKNVSKQLSQTSIGYWLNKGYSEEEAEQKKKEFYDTKLRGKRLLPTQLDYYIIKKGMSKKDAREALRKEQAKRSSKLVEKEIENPELRNKRLWMKIEYWTNKGYSEEIGYQLMQSKFEDRNLQTMKKLTQKYVDKGLSTSDALQKAQTDYKKRAQQIMKTRIKNKSFGFQKASQQSLNFFKPLMDHLDKANIKYYVGMEGNAEWFIAKGTDYFYSFDFYIPSQKLLIEFNGEHVHPNPKWSDEKKNEWRHCWTKDDFETAREKDLEKINIAEELGYNVVEVFESDNVRSIDCIGV